MNRWLVDGQIKIYAETRDKVYALFPEALSVEPYEDNSYLGIIDIIKSKAIKSYTDVKGSEVYHIPHLDSYIRVKLLQQDGEYLDDVMYQRWDMLGFQYPISWSMLSVKDFYDTFINEPDKSEQLPVEFVSMKHIKKIKATKICNKNNVVIWFDNDGYFYHTYKSFLPNKKWKEEYDRFHDNADAVLARLSFYSDETTRWYDSEEEMLKVFNEKKKDYPTAYATPKYEIKQRGYKKLPPDDRRVILRLPYINLNKELKLKTPKQEITYVWEKLLRMYGHEMSEDEFLMIINAYGKYINK